jgi:tyrosyl-tRNA synthetase
MAPSQALVLSRGSACYRCLFAYATRVAPIQRRGISQGYLQKKAAAEAQWKERAEQIREGKLYNLWDVFEERGYVKDTAGYVEPTTPLRSHAVTKDLLFL